MNAVMENILTRRSIRSFENREIKREELEQIVKAGLYAPSGHNYQTWKFTVITNTEKIQTLAGLMGKKLGKDNYDMYKPRVLIIPSNDKENAHSMEDNACAMENMFLAAHSFGIGSVWINQMRDICQDSEIRQLFREWEIPDNHVVFGMAALGYSSVPNTREVEKTGKVHYID